MVGLVDHHVDGLVGHHVEALADHHVEGFVEDHDHALDEVDPCQLVVLVLTIVVGLCSSKTVTDVTER